MTKFQEWPDAAIDVLVGGTPCQSFSVAGLRKGLADPRGNLMLTYLAIAAAISPPLAGLGERPRRLVEQRRTDFGALLGGLGKLGYGFAYRVLDAQYFGVGPHSGAVACSLSDILETGDVPQRFYLSAKACGESCAAPRSEAKNVAPTISARTQGGGGLGTDFDCDGGLIGTFQNTGQGWWNDHPVAQSLRDASAGGGSHANVVAHALRGEGFDASEDGTGRGTPLVPVGVTIHGTDKTERILSFTDVAGSLRTKPPGSQENSSTTAVLAFSCKDHGADAGEVSPTLRSMGHDGSHANAGGQVAIAFDPTQITSKTNRSNPQDGDPCHTLAKGQHAPAIAYRTSGNCGVMEQGEKVACLNTQTDPNQNIIQRGMAVRRLTPRECERLQGFPDDYTLISRNRKPAADGPRYKKCPRDSSAPDSRTATAGTPFHSARKACSCES
jgi:DNA (cytosine-5)-methyltransferase 1